VLCLDLAWVFSTTNHSYYGKFVSLDALGIVTEIISALEQLGVALFAHASSRNRDEIEEILETKPNKDGYYMCDGSEISKEELEDELDEIDNALDSMDEAINVIQKYFPNAEIGELNTGDY
jgi:DNA mismatch repair ATPase MutS